VFFPRVIEASAPAGGGAAQPAAAVTPPSASRWGYPLRRRTVGASAIGDGLVKLKLDLHDIYNRGQDIDKALRDVIDEAVRKKAPLVEIIPGKGSGQLKKHVLRFLQQKEIRALYHRVEKDSKNFGRLFVHFRW
jgi:DNA-nicking Smr family endonuclease